MALDISGISYFMPIYAFLLVAILMYALFAKTKLFGGIAFIDLLVALIIATIFITATSVRQYVTTIVPWFAVLIVALFFILIIIGFSQKDITSMMKPGLAWVFIVLVVLIFLVAGVKVFGSVLEPYLPGGPIPAEGPNLLFNMMQFIYSSRFLGAFLLLLIAALAAWVLTKK